MGIEKTSSNIPSVMAGLLVFLTVMAVTSHDGHAATPGLPFVEDFQGTGGVIKGGGLVEYSPDDWAQGQGAALW